MARTSSWVFIRCYMCSSSTLLGFFRHLVSFSGRLFYHGVSISLTHFLYLCAALKQLSNITYIVYGTVRIFEVFMRDAWLRRIILTSLHYQAIRCIWNFFLPVVVHFWHFFVTLVFKLAISFTLVLFFFLANSIAAAARCNYLLKLLWPLFNCFSNYLLRL